MGIAKGTGDMPDDTKETKLQLAERELTAAHNAYCELEAEERRARSNATAALNRLNAAQRAFDDAIAERRKIAHSASEWARAVARAC